MKKSLLLLSLFLPFMIFAQSKHTIQGFISQKISSERLIGASVYTPNTRIGTSSNSFGFYSITLSEGPTTLSTSFIGHTTSTKSFVLNTDTIINFKLEEKTDIIDEVIVTGNHRNKIEEVQMSMENIPVTKLKKIPAILAENDVLKVIQLLPGVQSGTEGTSGIYARGGSPDQNLILLDGTPVYNASHVLGFFSVFNPDVIKDVKLYKGGFPARYGGRLSSVVDISMKDGNINKLKGNFSIGLISSKLYLDGPIKKDKTSFMFSARRTYLDVISIPFFAIMNAKQEGNINAGTFFHDYNLKINHKFSDRSRLFLSGYFGKDEVYAKDRITQNGTLINDKFSLTWGNNIASLRWNYIISNKLFSNTTASYSNYNFSTILQSKEESDASLFENYFKYHSGIRNMTIKTDFDYFPSPAHKIKFGAAYSIHQYTPGATHSQLYSSESENLNKDSIFNNDDIKANDANIYIEDEIAFSKKFKMNAGLHFSLYQVGTKNYFDLQPRLNAAYKANKQLALKASYSRMIQYMHLLSNSGINLPTDLWVPVTDNLKPPSSDQLAIGATYLLKNGYTITSEAFYKTMNNLIAYKNGASFLVTNTEWENLIEKGDGLSYGIEFMLEKTIGQTTGWLSYTWSKNNRLFQNLNFGNPFPAKYDRRHDINLVVTHKFNDHVDMGATWVYGTGNAITLSHLNYSIADIPGKRNDYYKYDEVRNYIGQNNFRMPAYHRLDIGINLHKKKKRGIRTWSFSVYNVYSRLNPFMVYWAEDDGTHSIFSSSYSNMEREKVLKQISLIPIVPSFSYSYKF